MFDAFTVITGVVTIASFMIQVKQVLPRYQRQVTFVSSALLGFLGGVVVQSLRGVTLSLPVVLSVREFFGLALFFVLGSAAIAFMAISVLTVDDKRRVEARNAASGLSFFFVLCMMFTNFFSDRPTATYSTAKPTSTDERQAQETAGSRTR